ncbi:unnamed protein product [Rotaria sordida]|uniref:Uncharacterized protein n=2 Tax=Rotaria sordida TaxID=392033 RepID=A0A815RXB7_9BILA|nr:unnamed protein product [Rotaria sordida]CAF1648506.1 unnamed protein product [Rotaria sordida]
MKKTVKIVVDVSMYPSVELLSEPRVIDHISKQVYDILEKKRQKARDSAIIKACKNAVSLLLSKKKGIPPTILSVYLPMNIIESSDDTVVPSVSSDEDILETGVGEDDDSINSDQLSSFNSQGSHISFFLCNNVMTVNTTFEYLFDYFKHSLSINNKPMNLEKILTDVCSYAFLELNCSVNIRMLKNEISRQISQIVQSARIRAAGKSVIGVLRTKNIFSFIFKSINSLNRLEPSMGFIRYKNDDYLSPSLFIRENNDETAIFQFYPFPNIVEITINETLVRKALSSFDIVRALDINEISSLVSQCVATYDLKLNLPIFEEILKTKILLERSTLNSSYFLTMSVKLAEKEDQIDKVNEQSQIDDSHSFCEEEIDAIIGRTYSTRGVKRSFPYKEILGDEIAKSARSVVNKFKELLNEVKHNSVKRKGHLKRLCLEFVKEFRQSGLRTTVTPYIHIIGNHLFEFDEFNDLGDYNMQGVEKNNDRLSNIYFSSTNPAKNPLLTMLQKLYRTLEMNFEEEAERDAMAEFARTGVYDFVETVHHSKPSHDDDIFFHNKEQQKLDSDDEPEGQFDRSVEDVVEVEDESDIDLDESMIWAPEKRFETNFLRRTENRFKSFRRS